MSGHSLPTEPKVATAGSLAAPTAFGQCSSAQRSSSDRSRPSSVVASPLGSTGASESGARLADPNGSTHKDYGDCGRLGCDRRQAGPQVSVPSRPQ